MSSYSMHIHAESNADALGRQLFTMTWEEPDGIFRKELAKDGNPVGYRRGQCFMGVIGEHAERLRARGHVVTISATHGVQVDSR